MLCTTLWPHTRLILPGQLSSASLSTASTWKSPSASLYSCGTGAVPGGTTQPPVSAAGRPGWQSWAGARRQVRRVRASRWLLRCAGLAGGPRKAGPASGLRARHPLAVAVAKPGNTPQRAGSCTGSGAPRRGPTLSCSGALVMGPFSMVLTNFAFWPRGGQNWVVWRLVRTW